MRISVFVIFFFFVVTSFAQELSTKNNKAKKLFEQAQEEFFKEQNQKAIDKLEEAIGEDSCFYEAYLLASDIYRDIDSLFLQIHVLEKAVEIDRSRYPKLMYVLGNAYLRAGNYSAAKNAYEDYLSISLDSNKFNRQAQERLKQCDFAISQVDNPVPFIVENMGEAINSDLDEYWPSLTIDGKTLIFTRLCPSNYGHQNNFNQLQEDFYWSAYDGEDWQPAEPLVEINTPYNEGAQSVSADGKLIFFTACTQSDGYGSCDIYFTQYINGVWTKPRNVGSPVNSAAWESQPAISANGESLYFVSNRKGGLGGMDIWKCQLKNVGLGIIQWGELQNLGDSINTKGNEMSPFIHADSKTLYFASDKWPNMGGLDIFYTRQVNDTIWQRAKNLGYPINTHKDEQGLIVNASGNTAYYSSNRPGSKGLDIYQFNLYEDAQPNPVSYVKGRIIDKKDNHPLCAQVELMDVDANKLVSKARSCLERGEFLMCLPLGKEYAFNVLKEGYLFYSENFSLKEVRDVKDPIIMDISLNRIEVGEKAVLRNIFFKTDSYEILESSRAELVLLLSFLKNNPSIKVEIGGHTDNVGSEDYNQNLSELRAKAVYEFLVKNKLDAERLSFKGYGMSQPVSTNDSASGRAKNRRTEFRIISID
ncbi:OmpA family protein [Sunxiuqinia sp. A32]|uniref:OmpA family protein n=1 Tax=Sunxiuqinia sp. A32 TaxID=3461496 RepID=UPI00404533FF